MFLLLELINIPSVVSNTPRFSSMKETLTIILLLFAGKAIASCPEGFNLWYNGVCGHAVRYPEAYSYTYANSYCQSLGANLPSSHGYQEDRQLVIAANAAVYLTGQPDCHAFWYGLQCMSNFSYSWNDGTSYDYHHFHRDSDASQCGSNTAFVSYCASNYTWSAEDPSQQLGMIACTIRPSTNYSLCLNFDEVPNDSSECMKVFPDATQWAEAEYTCKENGGHLYSIHSDNENNFVKRTAIANGWNGLHIGLQMSNVNPKTANWTWTDATPTNYTNFISGFPDPTTGNCTAVQINTEPGKWSTIDCYSQMPFICHRSAKPHQPSTCISDLP